MTIVDKIKTLNGWSVQDEGLLTKTIQLTSYLDGVKLLNKIAEEADRQNHHPDMTLSYSTLTIELISHDAGEITDRDIALAQFIDTL